jgi:peptidyl-prolyl cis-trans isomerase SurA
MLISELTPEHKVISQLGEIRSKVLAGEDFAKYARLASVDSSATRGGDLGWITAGDADPEFETQMNALQIGDISEPFRTRYGYHIVQVLERRTETMDEKRTRLEARQALRGKKLAEAVQNWMRELHDKAYVEIRREYL